MHRKPATIFSGLTVGTMLWLMQAITVPSEERPPWLGNRAGISDELLAPWTPVEVKDTTISVWGRSYSFGPLPLPAEVTTAGAEILAGPVTLHCTADGQPITWSAGGRSIVEHFPTRAILRFSAQGGPLRCEGEVTTEFDGMIRCGLRLVPVADKITIENLILEIPFKSKHAVFMHSWPGRWGSAANSHAVPPVEWQSAFKPFVWIGDYERGLAWFCESDENFFPASLNRVIRVRRDGEITHQRVELIGKAQTVSQPLRYVFGFQATPVKPLQPDAWDYRIVHVGRYGLEKQMFSPPGQAPKLLLDYLAEAGVKTICFHEHWSNIQNYPEAARPEELHSLVEACHKRNIQLLLYFGYEMSNIAPEWEKYAEECLVAPRAGGYKRQPEQTAYIVCYRSHWQDFLAAGIERIIREFDIDGVYLDGTSEPWGCTNTQHGCGYTRPDGSIGPTYPFYDTRQMMKRIYTIVKHHNPAGQVNVHQSTCMVIPTLAFATSYWDGEQLQSVARPDSPTKLLPLEAFCAEFMGRNWGVPGELLWYANGPFKWEEAVSMALLHDIPVRPNVDRLELFRRLWRLFDEFDRHASQWIPYWQSSGVVACSHPEIKVSLYNRPGNGCILVAVNVGTEEIQADLTLGLSALGQSDLTIWDVLTDKEIGPLGEKMPLKLGPWQHAIFWLKPRRS